MRYGRDLVRQLPCYVINHRYESDQYAYGVIDLEHFERIKPTHGDAMINTGRMVYMTEIE